ncbi:MAG: phage integrase N-terminal SAM-like domain-containing protein [Candidatus Aenigmarchaeota archaeon]|nr:phage integrase N-terminal SAM-like domain-containing protein [Candidatus Aenigmarchaeota archaeon]
MFSFSDHLKKLDEEMQLRGFSQKTRKSYIFHVRHFLEFCRGSPSEVSVREYSLHLSSQKDPRTTNLALSAIKFFFFPALKKEIEDLRFKDGIIFIRQGKGNLEARNDSNPYVFDSARGGHLTVKSVQKIVENASKKAGIRKNVHVHTLRHRSTPTSPQLR